MADDPVFDPKEFESFQPQPATAPTFDPKEFSALGPTAKPGAQPQAPGRPYMERLQDIPGDVAEMAGRGLNATMKAPEKIFGTTEPDQETIDKAVRAGQSQEEAHATARHGQIGEGITELLGGPLEVLTSPVMGATRSMISRPVEEGTGIPKEATELGISLLSGRPRIVRGVNAAPITERLFDASNQGYTVARSLPIRVYADVPRRIADETAQFLEQRHSFLPDSPLTPATTHALQYMRGDNQVLPVNLNRVLTARDSLSKTARSIGADGFRTPDAAAASRAIEHIDQLLEGLPARDVFSGQHLLPTFHTELASARGNWGAGIRTEVVERLMDKATRRSAVTGTNSNMENTIRQNFNRILDNPKLSARYNDDELTLFRRIAEGDTPRNIARYVGKYGPSGPVSAGMTSLIGHATGIPHADKIMGGAGYISRKIGEARTRRAAAEARDAVSRRSPLYESLPQPGRTFRNDRIWPSIGAGQAFRPSEEEQ